MELKETSNIWKQRNHVMVNFQDTTNPKPRDFLSRFYEGYKNTVFQSKYTTVDISKSK
jgi:predicted secreted protein